MGIQEDFCQRLRPSSAGYVGMGLQRRLLQICDKYQSKEEGKDQESIQSRTRPDPGHHMGK